MTSSYQGIDVARDPSEGDFVANPCENRRYQIEGRDLGYPTLFHEGSVAMAVFSVPSKTANSIIASSEFEALEIAPGKAALTLICVNYTDTQVGSYRELALAFFVKKFEQRFRVPYLSAWRDLLAGNIASHTWYLPVTSPAAEQCGIQMWGFPKTIEDIRFAKRDGRAEFTLNKDGQDVLRFSVKAEGKLTPKLVSPPVYSMFEGKPHVGYLTQQFTGVGYHLSGAELTLGDHAIVEPLKRLGLPKKPMISGWMDRLEFSMSAPVALTEALTT